MDWYRQQNIDKSVIFFNYQINITFDGRIIILTDPIAVHITTK